jgi:hypothetical protein
MDNNTWTENDIDDTIIMVRDKMYFDPADCRNIIIPCDGLCTSAKVIEILLDAVKHYKTMKHIKKMENFL